MKRIFKYIRNVFIIIASLAAALLLFSQTGIFKELLRDFIVDELNKSIDGEITIGKISGNLFSNIEIREINLKGDEPLVAVKKIDVKYNIFSLISDKINVHSLVIDSADLNLVQSKDSSWNISKIFKSSSDTTSGLFNWSVFLDEFRINNCLVRISALDSAFPIPKKIENINLSASGFYTEEMSRFQLKTFSFNTSDPEVILKDFRFSAAGSKNNFHIKDFCLETGLNKIYGEGNIGSDFDDINIKIRTDPVNISEFGSFTDFRLNKIYPSVLLDINRKNENLFLHAILTEKKQRAEIELKLENTDPIKGIASIKTENLNLAELLEDKSLSGLINGRINIEGYWNNNNDCRVKLAGSLFNSALLKRKITKSNISAELKDGNLRSGVYVAGDFGIIDVKAEASNIFSSPVYSFHSTLNGVNLAPILLNDSLDTNLNLTIYGEGKSFNPGNMLSEIKISSNRISTIHDFRVDTLMIKARKEPGYFRLDSLIFGNSGNLVKANGEYRTTGEFKSDFRIDLNNLQSFIPLTGADTLSGKLEIIGKVSGLPDSLLAETDFNADSFLYNNMFLKSFKGSANASLIDSVISGSYNLLFNEIKYGDMNLRLIETAGGYKNRQLNSVLDLVYSDSLSLHAKSSVIFDSSIHITIPELRINFGGDSLLNRKGPVELAVSNNSYSIKNFNLQNDTGYILIDAEMTNEKYLNADVSIHSVEINKFFPGDEFYGLVNLDLKAGGNIGNPAAEGDLEITGLTIDSIETGNLTAGVKLKDKILDWNLTSVQPGGNKLKCSGFIPINLPPDDSSSFINEEKEFEVNISIDNYDLANADFISNYFDKIEGKINGEIHLKNNLKDPRLDGTLEISASNLKKDKMGIDYRNIKIKLEADPDKIWIDTAYITSSRGNITVSGFVGSKTNILTGEPDNVNLNLYSSDFEIIKGKENNVLLDGSLHLYSEKGSTRFDGDFIIPRSSIFLPSLTKTKTTGKDDKPFLVQAVLPGDRNKIKDIDTAGYSIPELNPVKDINGIIKIRIPDNTWVKSSNVNIELNGDLIIEKTGADIVLKGKIKTGRGYLYFYGKKFNVTKGELVFNGEKPINPFIDVTIEYNFRSPAKEKEKIEISVTNTINDPRITYTHDDEIINEGDAVSYIVFGTKMENLTQSQQSEMSGNQNVVTDAVTGMLASGISSQVGRAIGLDVFEISGEDNWQSAYLTAGKYATDDLYISYKHGIPIGNSSETEIKTLNLEYEILDFLFIQVIGGNSEESGMNIIIKLD